MAWLALDASTEACAVGIQTDDGQIFDAFEIAPRRHTELLPQMLDSVLARSGIAKQELEGCIVGVGPGAFTGIRIGVATIQGIALGLNIPCYAVSSLHAIAQQALFDVSLSSGSVLACIDARMDEVYCAEYVFLKEERSIQLVGSEYLVANDAFVLPEQSRLVAGTGVVCIKQKLHQEVILLPECYPTAQSLFEIKTLTSLKPVAAEYLIPSYIRNQVTS